MFPINWERLDASVFTSMLPATRRKSRTCATRKTDVISERKHCSRRRRHTQVDFRTWRKCAQTKRRQSHVNAGTVPARKRKRSNARPTCGRLYNANYVACVQIPGCPLYSSDLHYTTTPCLALPWSLYIVRLRKWSTRGQDYKRFSSMSRCSTHNLCSEMT